MKRFTKSPGPRSTNVLGVMSGALTLVLSATTALVHAQSPATPGAAGTMVYPARGQSLQQQDKDKYQCYDWARTRTGFDPANSAQVASAAAPTQSRGPGAAMLKGAAGGAAVARIAHGETGRGAAAGAMGAAMRERAQEQQLAQARQQQSAQQRAAYEGAFSACMEGRGYTVR